MESDIASWCAFFASMFMGSLVVGYMHGFKTKLSKELERLEEKRDRQLAEIVSILIDKDFGHK